MSCSFSLSYKATSFSLNFDSPSPTISSLLESIQELTGVSAETHNIKLLVPGRRALVISGPRSGPLDHTLHEAGIASGTRVMLLATSLNEASKLHSEAHAAQLLRMRGFDSELKLVADRNGLTELSTRRKRSQGTMLHTPPPQARFNSYQSWTPHELKLHPPPSEALSLLYSLAADPGIVAVMKEKEWTVGMLSEMPPAGKVGISPVCILGLNVNGGQEIQLRLRTDDLKGFRKYRAIRDTLCHELAHNVFGEHNSSFKALNSEIKERVEDVNGSKRVLTNDLGGMFDLSNQSHWSFLGDEEETGHGQRRLMDETSRLSGRPLGGKDVDIHAAGAAAKTAMRRHLSQFGTFAAEENHNEGMAYAYEREDEGTRRDEQMVKRLED